MNTAQVFKGHGIQPWFVRLIAPNGQTLSISEGYFSKWNAKRAARRMFPEADLKDMTK